MKVTMLLLAAVFETRAQINGTVGHSSGAMFTYRWVPRPLRGNKEIRFKFKFVNDIPCFNIIETS